MPLNAGCSITAYRANISELISKGKLPSQAVAISIDQLKRSCLRSGEPMPDIGEVPDNVMDLSIILSLLADLNDSDEVDIVLSKVDACGW
jgi:hypothetical protein